MSNEKELLHGLLTQAYGLNEEGVSSLYNEDKSELKPDALNNLLNIDKERIAKIKPDEKKIREEMYGRATREVMTNYEKQIREKYGVTSEKQGIELIDDLIAEYRKDDGGQGLTDDQIKKSKLFLDYTEKFRAEKQGVVDEYEGKLNQLKSEVQERESWYQAKDGALKLLDSLKPILPEGKEDVWKQIFLDNVRKINRVVRDGSIVLLDDEGNDLQDGHGHRITFDQKVKEIADGIFTYHKGEDRGTPPYKPGTGGTTKFTFTSENDYLKQDAEEKDAQVRIEMAAAFRKWKNGG